MGTINPRCDHSLPRLSIKLIADQKNKRRIWRYNHIDESIMPKAKEDRASTDPSSLLNELHITIEPIKSRAKTFASHA